MDKFSFIALWDAYSGLLTRTQQEITDLYLNKDLTASEIADAKGVSRQAVSECLKGCKRQLEEYEGKLHLLKRLKNISLQTSFMLTDADRWAEQFVSAHPHFSEDIGKLKRILTKDYSSEVEQALKNSELSALSEKDKDGQ